MVDNYEIKFNYTLNIWFILIITSNSKYVDNRSNICNVSKDRVFPFFFVLRFYFPFFKGTIIDVFQRGKKVEKKGN